MSIITAQDVDVILEADLASHDPAAPVRLFTVLQGLLTPTAQQTSKNVVYLHRGINASKRIVVENVRPVDIVNGGRLLNEVIA